MSVLLMHLAGSRLYNKTLFRPHLYIYDDHLVYKKRHIFTHDEFSINYKHVSQVNYIRVLLMYAHIELITTGQRNIHVNWIPKGKGKKAKKIIDQKVYHAHASHKLSETRMPKAIRNIEMSLKRLKELVNTEKISKREYEKKRKQLLKKHY